MDSPVGFHGNGFQGKDFHGNGFNVNGFHCNSFLPPANGSTCDYFFMKQNRAIWLNNFDASRAKLYAHRIVKSTNVTWYTGTSNWT